MVNSLFHGHSHTEHCWDSKLNSKYKKLFEFHNVGIYERFRNGQNKNHKIQSMAT